MLAVPLAHRQPGGLHGEACERLPPALVALSAARWLETTHRSLFIHFFRDVDREVAPGEPWPIAESPAAHYRPRGRTGGCTGRSRGGP